MNRTEEKKKKQKRILLLIASLVITAVFAGGVFFSINALGEAKPEASVDQVHEDRSQLLVSGQNYSLEKEQEELYSRELEREEEVREEEQKDEPKQDTLPEETVESIVKEEKEQKEEPEKTPPPEENKEEPQTEEQTPTPEPTVSETPTPTPDAEPTPTVTPTPTPTPSITPTPTPSATPTPTPEPTVTPDPDDSSDPGEGEDEGGPGDDGDPGDEGTPVPTKGPDGGEDGDGEGEGEEGENPTPTPEPTDEPPQINTDPVIYCDLSNGEYGSKMSFTVMGADYKGRLIDSFNYSIFFDGSRLSSTGVDGSGYATYRPDSIGEIAEGYHEITVTVTDTEGHASSITYTPYITVEADVLTTETVGLTVDASSIGIGVLLSDWVQIYPGESAASMVSRTLRAWGFEPTEGYDAHGYYLARISREGLIDLNLVPEEYRDLITDTNSLGERDVSSFSGWLYSWNEIYMDVGMSEVTLTDGDTITVWFSLNPGG